MRLQVLTFGVVATLLAGAPVIADVERASRHEFLDETSVRFMRQFDKKGDRAPSIFSPEFTYQSGLVFLGLLLADDWSGSLYVDPQTFNVRGDVREYWLITRLSRNRKYARKLERLRLDCSMFEETPLSFILQNRAGKPVKSVGRASASLLAPETLGRAVADAVCRLPTDVKNCDGAYKPCIADEN